MRISLTTYIQQRDWQGLYNAFDSMSNSEFRRKESYLRDFVLPTLDNALYWDAMNNLLRYRIQAFLTGFLSLRHLVVKGTLDFSCPAAVKLASFVCADHPDAVEKILRMSVPQLNEVEHIEQLFQLFAFTDSKARVGILMLDSRPAAYYIMYKSLLQLDDRSYALRCCVQLLKKRDDISYNMASILRTSFNLSELQSTLSLNIEPYELDYIEHSYDRFKHFVEGKRPKLI